MVLPHRPAHITLLAALLVSGCGGSGNTQPDPVVTSHDEFNYVNGDPTRSSVSPYASSKADYAYSQGYTGANQLIAIVDSSFDTNHQEISGKSTSLLTYGTLGIAASNDHHGLAVSSIAAGAKDGKGIHGLAYDANLHLSDYTYFGNQTYLPDRWVQLTNHAASHGAIVQNNSWGIDESLSSVNSHIQSNNLSNAQGVADYFTQYGYTANASSVNNYVAALDNFQNTGVIVYATSNNTNFQEPDFQAALPELFPSLKEAWLTVTNIDVVDNQYIRTSAKCGASAQYCLGADGRDIRTAAYGASNDRYDASVSGTSFAAPQVSGGIAILKQAFPNHSPTQLTERLLASAHNDFFNSTTYTTFGNGVLHYYNDEFGHGFMDLQAALAPIVVTGTPRMITGSNLENNQQHQIHSSQLKVSSSFGDALYRGLVGKQVYVYDALNGGFAYPLTNSLRMAASSPQEQLNHYLDQHRPTTAAQSSWQLSTPYNQTANWQLAQPLGPATLLTELQQRGHEQGAPRISIAWRTPSYQRSQAYLETGIHQAPEQLLGLQGSGGLNLQGSRGISNFVNLQLQHRFTPNLQLSLQASAAKSQLNTSADSLIQGFEDVISHAFRITARQQNLFTQDQLTLQVQQPHYVQSGTLQVNIADLANTQGQVQQTTQQINLTSSGQQLDWQLSYHLWLRNNLQLGLHHLTSIEPNHMASADTKQLQTISLEGDIFAAVLGYDANLQTTNYFLRWQGEL